jgi:hypothetical protein
MSEMGHLETSPASPRMSLVGCEADEIRRKADMHGLAGSVMAVVEREAVNLGQPGACCVWGAP